mgnify:CR=1 FL=1
MLKSGLLHAKMQPFTSAQTINVRFVEKFLLLSIFIITFVSLCMFKPDNGRNRVGGHFRKGVYYVDALFLTLLESGSFNSRQRRKATVDAYVDVVYPFHR